MTRLTPLFLLLAASIAAAQPVIFGVGGIEDEQPNIAPRGYAAMLGDNFTGGGETKVFVNGVEGSVPPQFLFDEELVFQVPPETPVGPATFTVSVGSVMSAPFAFTVSAFAPIIADIGDAFHLDGSPVTVANPTVPGETAKVTVITGLGAEEPPNLSITVDGFPVQIISLEDDVEPFFADGIYTLTAVVPTGLTPGFYPGLFTIGGVNYLTSGFLEVGVGAVPPPAINIGGIVLSNLLPTVNTVSPLSIISIFGQNFTDETILFPNLDDEDDLETTLGGACVEFNGERGSIFAATPKQLNVQAPALDALGPIAVVAVRDCDTNDELRSEIEMVTVEEATPGFFIFDPVAEDGLIAARFNDSGIAVAPDGLFDDEFGPSRPAVPGDIILLFGSGWGPTAPSFATGELATGAAEVLDEANVMVTFGGIPLAPEDILYVGVTPNTAGLYQLAIRIPAGAQPGANEVVLTVYGKSTPVGPVITTGAL